MLIFYSQGDKDAFWDNVAAALGEPCRRMHARGAEWTAVWTTDPDDPLARRDLRWIEPMANGFTSDAEEMIDACLPADAFCIWNGEEYPLPRLVRAAKRAGLRTIFLENGFLPGTVQVDPDGVNAASRLARVPMAMIAAHAVTDATRDRLRALPTGSRPAVPVWRELPPCNDGQPVPDECLFVPLQVHIDTQVEYHSPRYGYLRDLLDDAAAAATFLNLPLVVKAHPNDLGYLPPDCVPCARWYRRTSHWDILAKAACVVTLNSSVGVDALRAGVPVVACGDAAWARPGLAHVQGDRPLQAVVASALTTPVNDDLRVRYLAWLLDVGLVGAAPEGIAARLQAIAAGDYPPW